MITVEQAVKKFKNKHPDLTITAAAMYDNSYYLFVALKDPKVVDYDDPYYAVDKNSGEVFYFTPANDLEKFNEAFREHKLDIGKG